MNISKVTAFKKDDLREIRSSTYAIFLLFVATFVLAIGFFTPFWLQSENISDQRFQKLGLWQACFARLHDPQYRYDRVISGCKLILDEDYAFLIGFLEPTFFIVTQILYTSGFLLMVLVCAGIVAVKHCFIIEREEYALRALLVVSLLSAISCSAAVIIFAIYGTRDDWMPDPEHNYLSWSFAAGLIGSVTLWVSSVLFYVEMRLILRQARERN